MQLQLGYLEGALTFELIYQRYKNFYQATFKDILYGPPQEGSGIPQPVRCCYENPQTLNVVMTWSTPSRAQVSEFMSEQEKWMRSMIGALNLREPGSDGEIWRHVTLILSQFEGLVSMTCLSEDLHIKHSLFSETRSMHARGPSSINRDRSKCDFIFTDQFDSYSYEDTMTTASRYTACHTRPSS